MYPLAVYKKKEPWNKGKLVGQKLALKQKQIWAIRIRLEISGNIRDLALFSLGLDSKLRGCDLVSLRVRDIALGMNVQSRAKIIPTIFSNLVSRIHRICLRGNIAVLSMGGYTQSD